MLVVNLGTQGMNKNGILFKPGVNVEVTNELGEYLLKKYFQKKFAIYFQKALSALEHLEVQKKEELPVVPEVVQPQKRGRKTKK